MHRSRRNDSQGDAGGGSTAAAASRKREPGGRRGSFASATASSLARGGPDSSAPPAKSASAKDVAKMAPPKPNSGGESGDEKENVANGNGDSGGCKTPSKKPMAKRADDDGDGSTTPKPVLSPTPYWKVQQERGGKSSPRTTRSATKKAQQHNAIKAVLAPGMRQLDEQEDYTGSSSSEEEEDTTLDPTALHFSPPVIGVRAQSLTAHARKRRDAEAERERARQAKVRKASMLILDNNGLRQNKRTAKRPKQGHFADSKGAEPAAVGPSAEEMRQLMQQTLAENNSHRIEELVAKSTAAESDAKHYQMMYEELRKRYDLLEEQSRAKEGSEGELQARCAEQRAIIDGLEKEVARLERDNKELHDNEGELRATCAEQKDAIEKHVAEISRLEGENKEKVKEILQLECDKKELEGDAEAFDDERKRMDSEQEALKRDHASEMQRAAEEAAKLREARDETGSICDEALAELRSTKAELAESMRANEELERAKASGEEGKEELVARIAELVCREADLNSQLSAAGDAIKSYQDTIASLQSDVTTHLAAISTNEGAIAQLEADLQATKVDLEGAKRKMEGMQSPRSRDAMAQGFNDEVVNLKEKLSNVQGEKVDLDSKLRQKDEENVTLKAQLDGVKIQNKELQSQREESNGHLKETTDRTNALKAEKAELLQQIQVATAKREEDGRQLEEMALENEQLFKKLESTKRELQQKIQDLRSEAQSMETKLAKDCAAVTAENEALDAELRQARNDISQLQSRVSTLEGELAKSREMTSTHEAEKLAADQKLTELSSQLQTLTEHLEAAQRTIAMLEAKLREREEYCEQFTSVERRLVREKRVLDEIRRNLHNRVIQLSGNIRVFVRVRPLVESEQKASKEKQQGTPSKSRRLAVTGRPSSRGSPHPKSRLPSRGSALPSSSHRSASQATSQKAEEAADECPFRFPSITDRNTNSSSSTADPSSSSPNYTSFNDLTKQTIELTEPYKDRGGLTQRRQRWKYGFDRVFNPHDTQDDVWEGAEPLVQSCVDGFQVCMFAYGQTGSGKTHTMIGDSQNQGLIPRAVQKLFASKREVESSRRGEVSVDIRVELLEVYNEEVRDLLDDAAGPDGQLLKLKLSSNEAVGNVKVVARDEREVARILRLAQERRCVKATKSNAESSRSHLLFTIHFEVSPSASASNNADVTRRSGCLHIVDLAGSERLDKSGSHGALLTEAKHINASLSALALVIEKLQARNKRSSSRAERMQHVPYRDSKLTYLLRNSLGGDSKTLAIVCCSPHVSHFHESLNSIRFAAKASKVELKEGNTVDF